MIPMPGRSHAGPLPELSEQERATAARLREDVTMLAETIGPRSLFRFRALEEAALHIERELANAALSSRREVFTVHPRADSEWEVGVANIVAEIPGREPAAGIILVGAHYDSCLDTPGANDNGSGVAVVLELARRFADAVPRRTLRFVLFVNEEPPFFQTEHMGSLVHARGCVERGETITAMLSIETLGYYRDEPGTQRYPAPMSAFYPDTGNFIGFVGNVRSRSLVRRCVGVFRERVAFPCEGGALYGGLPGVGWSDHWAFWQIGVPAVMVTDTAPYRYPHYHTLTDTPEKLDYERMARVVTGLEIVIEDLLNGD